MTAETSLLNFGGFIPVSTVDWHGRSACVVFFRGCNIRCPYCHNAEILGGEDYRPLTEIFAMVREAKIASSSLVISGGEPTLQPEAVIELARMVRDKLGMETCLFTNGLLPFTLDALLETSQIQKVSLDIKPGNPLSSTAREIAQKQWDSVQLCRSLHSTGHLPEFEITFTLFRGQDQRLIPIWIPEGIPIILQQGYTPTLTPLTEEELQEIAQHIHSKTGITIRTRENGEMPYG